MTELGLAPSSPSVPQPVSPGDELYQLLDVTKHAEDRTRVVLTFAGPAGRPVALGAAGGPNPLVREVATADGGVAVLTPAHLSTLTAMLQVGSQRLGWAGMEVKSWGWE